MNTIPRFFAPLLAAMLAGCAAADFTPYQGAQQNWPTARGAFVSTNCAVPAYYGLPPRPYRVLGYLGATTAPVRQRGVVAFAAQRAKEIGGDAIIVQSSGRQYVGTISSEDTSVYGHSFGSTVYANANTSGESIPLFAGKASVLIIKFK